MKSSYFFTSFLFPALAFAGVNLKNGNFFISFRDIEYKGGFEPKIERVYNSKSAYRGYFGHGWGTEFEVHLKTLADGSVVVHEYGSGAENVFTPVKSNAADVKAAVTEISQVARALGVAGNQAQLAAYRARLSNEIEFRNQEWEKFVAQGKLKPRVLSKGTQLKSTRFSYQYITRVEKGFIRTFENGRTETFDNEGKLIQVSDRNNNFIRFQYGNDRRLSQMSDNLNRKIGFTFNSKGLLEKIVGDAGATATFVYNAKDELIQSKDVDQNAYTYSYSPDRHNLIEVGYNDKTSMKVSYWDLARFENVKSVQERDGSIEEYEYVQDPKSNLHYSIKIASKGSDGKSLGSSSYEYFIGRRANGEDFTQRLIETFDGIVTDTTYHPDLGLPVQIKRGTEITRFQYDAKGHVLKKDTPEESTTISYHSKFGKVIKTDRILKGLKGPDAHSWAEFMYDANNGNLVSAKNSDKKSVRLIYDRLGRIQTMLDQDKRRVDLKYNEAGRPSEVIDAKLGSIRIEYANNGDIKDVTSPGGRRIATEVGTVVSGLMDLVRQAGVDIGF